MKRLEILLVIGLTISLVDALNAEETTPGESTVGLDRITVTNRRTPSYSAEATEDIELLAAEQIEKLPARNLSEVLSYIPGVDVPPGRGFGRATSISIQGSDSRQVRVMIDGIPLNSQSSGQVNPAEFPLENIKRIEIIKGGASSLWGSGLGGVINIITKDTGNTLIPKGNATVSFAGFRTKKESFDLAGGAGGFGYYILSSLMESGGKGPHDDVLEKKGFGKISYDLKEAGKITASFGYNGANVNSGIFPDGTWLAQPYRERYGKIGWENKLGTGDVRIDLKHSRKDIITRFFNSAEDTEPALEVKNRDILYQLSINSAFHPRNRDLFILGVDSDYDTVKSANYLPKAKSVRIYAPYANYTLKIGRLDINSGLRYDRNSEFGEQVSPSWGAVYHFKNIPDTLIRIGASRAFNAPPLLWKFNENIAFNVAGNPNIKAERAWVYEAGFENRIIPAFWYKLSLYTSDVRDALETTENEAGQFYKKNFKRFKRQGAEFQCKLKISEEFNFLGGAAFNDIEDKETGLTVRGGGKPRQSFNLGLEYRNESGFSVTLLGHYDRWNEPASPDPSLPDSNDRKMLLDLRISWEWKNFTTFLNVYNLTNSKYWSDPYFPLPERYFEGGVTIKW